jgi:hypothetical protein
MEEDVWYHVRDGALLKKVGVIPIKGGFPGALMRCTACGSVLDVSDVDEIARKIEGLLVDYRGRPFHYWNNLLGLK